MSYWNRATVGKSYPQADSVGITSRVNVGTGGGNTNDEFYEIEPAVVLDIILDKNHPYFKSTMVPNQSGPSTDGLPAAPTDLDYTWIGRALVRMVNTQKYINKQQLIWAMPLESNISEYPLINEVVGVMTYLGQQFYTRKMNIRNLPNQNADFNVERNYGLEKGNVELINPNKTYQGPESKLTVNGGSGYQGVLGRYFKVNHNIRNVRRFEGDLTIESRFGQSIRFSSYDNNRDNDKSDQSYKDYSGTSPYTVPATLNIGTGGEPSGTDNLYIAGGGNPMILIRNRQKPVSSKKSTEEKNEGGYISEDVNNDGSSIHITSGLTTSQFFTTCKKVMWGDKSEEQSGFNGPTNFKYPSLTGDQIVVNSDRIVISSKKNEMFHFSKKRMSFVTDDEFTVDAHNQIVLNTNIKTVINSPAIYLGQYDKTGEPAMLGQTTINWLYELCTWLETHTHWHYHTHPDILWGSTGQSNPVKTQNSVEVASLMNLKEDLASLLSRRVFITGGGFSSGVNGEALPGVSGTPTKIDVKSGIGVPGGFSADTYRIDPSKMTSTAKESFLNLSPPTESATLSESDIPEATPISTAPTINTRILPKIRYMSGVTSADFSKNLSATELTDAQSSVQKTMPATDIISKTK
jgi:hypothetical protein